MGLTWSCREEEKGRNKEEMEEIENRKGERTNGVQHA